MGEVTPAPSRIHGSLVEVAGVGVLLLGKSGIGKSECALELVMRGHRLVADDVVLIGVDAEGIPLGWSPELVRHYIELRGIGIVHVPSLFGERSVAERVRVELVIQLEAWGAGEVERVGLDQHKEVFAGFEIAALHLPVAPGRNIASLVEVAARVHLLQRQGRSGAADLDQRLFALLRGGRL
jgi:HPr kinase/phosphorylase